MDSGNDWRVIDGDDERAATSNKTEHTGAEDRVPHWLIGAIVAVVGAACALAIWATLPVGGVALESTAGPLDPRGVVGDVSSVRASGSPVGADSATVVVDVEGAVLEPGLHELPGGSRVGDALVAAGGYAPSADIVAAGQVLNLAAKLTDGQQIRVPALGDATTASAVPDEGSPGGSGSSGSGGLIDLNHASAEELDTLPGIGPVTAAKIIDARSQAPFAMVDELQSRGVVGQSTFDKLRDLVTVTP